MTGKAIYNDAKQHTHGVTALVCACCEQVVGVVNVGEALRMMQADEPYICRKCMTTLPVETVEVLLDTEAADWQWYQTMTDGLMTAMGIVEVGHVA